MENIQIKRFGTALGLRFFPAADSRTDSAAVCSASRADCARGIHIGGREHTERQQEGQGSGLACLGAGTAPDCRRGCVKPRDSPLLRHPRAQTVRQAAATATRVATEKSCRSEQFAQGSIILPKIQHTAVKALAVAVSCTVNAPLKNMRRTEILQFLDVLREQQPRVLIKPHIEFSGVLAEQPGQQVGADGAACRMTSRRLMQFISAPPPNSLTESVSSMRFKVSAVI